jgi:hypothetical protein
MPLHLPSELTPAHVAFLDFVWAMELKYADEIAADAALASPPDQPTTDESQAA